MKPWIFALGTNVAVILIISAIAYGWMALFNSVTIKLYGDHCVYDRDCALDMNYICQNGKCECTSTTYLKSASSGCGKLDNFYFILSTKFN